MMTVVGKVLNKIKQEGLLKFFVACFNFANIFLSRLKFKALAILNFKIVKSYKPVQFKEITISKLNLISDEDARKFLANVKNYKYFVLSDIEFNCKTNTWNTDFLTGRTWPKNIWGVDIKIESNNGDIKRPWELGRLHQLVQLGLIFQSSKDQNIRQEALTLASMLLKDFSNENDFFNGPQWMCAMDVGIRIANIVTSVSLFGEVFAKAHQDLLAFEVARHKFFILQNLENKPGHVVSNHYLANIAGLLFSEFAMRNKDTAFINQWQNEIIQEGLRQFLPDGGNFEGSTYYHRLSTELFVFSLIISSSALNNWTEVMTQLKERLQAMLRFSTILTDFEGRVPQIGDNDSGHLFVGHAEQYLRDDLNHQQVIQLLKAFIEKPTTLGEALLVFNSNEATSYPALQTEKLNIGSQQICDKYLNEATKLNPLNYLLPVTKVSAENLKATYFKDFGLIVCSSPELYMTFRVGFSQSDAIGGHRHYDQLAFFVKSKTYRSPRDPGSYMYTANTEQRNLFRSAFVHCIPFCSDTFKGYTNLFALESVEAECLFARETEFLGLYKKGAFQYFRHVKLTSEGLRITDWTNNPLPLVKLNFEEKLYSSRYGVRMACG